MPPNMLQMCAVLQKLNPPSMRSMHTKKISVNSLRLLKPWLKISMRFLNKQLLSRKITKTLKQKLNTWLKTNNPTSWAAVRLIWLFCRLCFPICLKLKRTLKPICAYPLKKIWMNFLNISTSWKTLPPCTAIKQNSVKSAMIFWAMWAIWKNLSALPKPSKLL